MGYYLQTPTTKGKAAILLTKFGGTRLHAAPRELPITNHAVVCVVDNGPFEAAGVMYSQEELDYFSKDRSGRKKEWLLLDNKAAVFTEAGLAELINK